MHKSYSVHDLVKDRFRSGKFIPDYKINNGRRLPMFGQEAVYKAIFNKKYNSHRAKDDVMALIEIYNYLNGDNFANRDKPRGMQTSLFEQCIHDI